MQLVDLKAFPFIKEVNADEEFDYVFVEGLVADKGDLEILQKLRKTQNSLCLLEHAPAQGAFRHTGSTH